MSQIPFIDMAEFFHSLKTAEPVPEQPAAAPVEQILPLYGQLANLKITTAMAYRVYSESLRGEANTALGEHFKEHAEHHLEDADFFVRRCSVLGGPADFGEVTLAPSSTATQDILHTLAGYEQECIAAVTQILQAVHGSPSQYELEAMVARDQHHLDDLWQHIPDSPGTSAVQPTQPEAAPSPPAETVAKQASIFSVLARGERGVRLYEEAKKEQEGKNKKEANAVGGDDGAIGKHLKQTPPQPLGGGASGQHPVAKLAMLYGYGTEKTAERTYDFGEGTSRDGRAMAVRSDPSSMDMELALQSRLNADFSKAKGHGKNLKMYSPDALGGDKGISLGKHNHGTLIPAGGSTKGHVLGRFGQGGGAGLPSGMMDAVESNDGQVREQLAANGVKVGGEKVAFVDEAIELGKKVIGGKARKNLLEEAAKYTAKAKKLDDKRGLLRRGVDRMQASGDPQKMWGQRRFTAIGGIGAREADARHLRGTASIFKGKAEQVVDGQLKKIKGGALAAGALGASGGVGYIAGRAHGKKDGEKRAASKSDEEQVETGRQRAIANLASGFTSDEHSKGERRGGLAGRVIGAAAGGGGAAGFAAARKGSLPVRLAAGLGGAALGGSLGATIGKSVGQEHDAENFWHEHPKKEAFASKVKDMTSPKDGEDVTFEGGTRTTRTATDAWRRPLSLLVPDVKEKCASLNELVLAGWAKTADSMVHAPDPAIADYVVQEEQARAAQEDGESTYLREQLQAAQQAIESKEEEVAQLQGSVSELQEQTQMQQDTLSTAQATTEQSMGAVVEKSNALMNQMRLNAEMSQTHQSLKEQLQSLAQTPSPPLTGGDPSLANQAAGAELAGQDQAAADQEAMAMQGGAPPAGPGAPPGAPPAPPPGGQTESGPPKIAGLPRGTIGGVLGAIGGAGIHAMTVGKERPNIEAAIARLEQSGDKSFSSALALAALRNQANMEDVATEHPVATGLMSAGMGAMAGAGLERAGRRLFAKEPWHAALNPYPLK